jgi:hypothetical protein
VGLGKDSDKFQGNSVDKSVLQVKMVRSPHCLAYFKQVKHKTSDLWLIKGVILKED